MAGDMTEQKHSNNYKERIKQNTKILEICY